LALACGTVAGLAGDEVTVGCEVTRVEICAVDFDGPGVVELDCPDMELLLAMEEAFEPPSTREFWDDICVEDGVLLPAVEPIDGLGLIVEARIGVVELGLEVADVAKVLVDAD
jgi:hypothetical protein